MASAPPVTELPALIIPFQPRWLRAIHRLLEEAGLPTRDIRRGDLPRFRVALGPEGSLVGVAGLELHGSVGLLRSVAVAPAHRSGGIGRGLVKAMEQQARELELDALYLLTDTAEPFFARLGYRTCERPEAPPEIAATKQFTEECPDTAAFLRKRIH